jgi:tRNA U38,U39,U40 pseudouridine synthase TruA
MKAKHKNPTLEELFIASVRYTAIVDAQNQNQTVQELKAENDSFYERSVRTFVKVAYAYYSEDSVRDWIKNNLIDEKKLPNLT